METRDTPPAHLLMRIQSFSMLSKYGIRKYESREFEAGDYKWRLIIYPDGDKCDKKGDHVAAYIATTASLPICLDWEVNVIFNIFLLNQNLDKYLCFRGEMRRFNATNSKWGYSKLISNKTMADQSKGYLVHDNCVFGAEVFVYKRQQVIECVSIFQDTSTCKHDLKISEFSKLKESWTSKEFPAGGHKWMIKLYPNGHASVGHYVAIYLYCVDCKSFASHRKVRANFRICIKNKNKRRHLPHCSYNISHWFTSSSDNWGFRDFISIDDMRDPIKGFIVDDYCFLQIEISIQAIVGNAPKLD